MTAAYFWSKGALSIARSVIPHSTYYPPFRSLLPQNSFRKLLSAFPQITNTLAEVHLCLFIEAHSSGMNIMVGTEHLLSVPK